MASPDEGTTSAERAKWEQPRYVPQPYPRMLYRGVAPGTSPHGYETIKVDDEGAERAAAQHGWKTHPVEAIDAYKALQADIGQAAAERAYTDRQMSRKAQAEAAAAEEAHDGHLGEVPETPVKKTTKFRKSTED